jgi:hypothetical protein
MCKAHQHCQCDNYITFSGGDIHQRIETDGEKPIFEVVGILTCIGLVKSGTVGKSRNRRRPIDGV